MSNLYTGLPLLADRAMRSRCAERLLRLRERLAPLRAKRSDSSLLLATWNIRDFGAHRFAEPRLPESIYYLAEIASCFDLIALQEVNRDLSEFEQLVAVLGDGWDYILTDATEGVSGNGERMAFLFDRAKVRFRHIAGEIVLPSGQLVVADAERPAVQPDRPATIPAAGQQFARTPFLVAFQAGWFRFNLCTVHIYYGKESGPELKRRIAEIRALVDFFARRQDAEGRLASSLQEAENYILLGDFNVVSPEHDTMAALKRKGFVVPDQIDARNVAARDHFYDQIAVRAVDPRFRVLDGGVVDLFTDVFTDADLPVYEHLVPTRPRNRTALRRYQDWRTWQLSDHEPLWVQVQTDFSDTYLKEVLATER
ncbi:MAG: endonuclease/exonuclease/phosphatase family protein [Propionicimonas sp.]|nr:endonuclease/exonuclease/phosphatase family protein [Propionicimonas sp.]